MTLGRLTRGLFSLNFSKTLTIPSASHLVLKAFQSSFKSHPCSYTALPFDKSRVGYPLINPVVQAVIKRAFSSSPQPTLKEIGSSSVEEAFEKIETNPENIPEILKNLPIDHHEKLALRLLDKNPKALSSNLLHFKLEEHSLVSIVKQFCSLDKKSGFSYGFTEYIYKNFKEFKFTDKIFIKQFASSLFKYACLKEIESSKGSPFTMMGITDVEIIQDLLFTLSQDEPKFFLSEYKKIQEDLAHLQPEVLEKILSNVLQNLQKTVKNDNGLCSVHSFAKVLPFLALDPHVRESIVLKITEINPKSLVGTLEKLQLSSATLEKVVSNIIPRLKIVRDYQIVETFIKELPSLKINNIHFLEESILTLVDKGVDVELLMNLASFNFPKDFTQNVITKIVNSHLEEPWVLSVVMKEVFLHKEMDHGFIQSIAITIASSSDFPHVLAIHLDELHLPENILKKVILQMFKEGPIEGVNGSDIYPFYSLLKRLPNLPLDLETKKEFYEQTLFVILNEKYKKIDMLVSLLDPNLVSEKDLKRIIEKECSQKDAFTLLERMLSFSFEESFFEELVVSLAKIHPEVLSDHLGSLKEEVLKKVISHTVDVFSLRSGVFGASFDPVFLEKILKNLATLNDKNFINEISLKISTLYLANNWAFELKDFPVSDEKTLKKIAKNLIRNFKSIEIIEEIMSHDIKDPEFIQSIAEIAIGRYFQRPIERLIEPNSQTNLPFFAHIFKIEDLSLRKEIAKNILKDCSKGSTDLYQIKDRFTTAISLLGLEKTDIVEEILSDVCRSQRLIPGTFAVLSQSSLFASLISPSFFVKQWGLGDQELPTPPSKEVHSLSESFNRFFNRPEIEKAFMQEGAFKETLLNTLYRLDHKNIPSGQKLSILLTMCQAHLDPLPPIEEITGNMILENIISSGPALDFYVYEQRLKEIANLNIQNPVFFENMALILADKNPDFLISSLEFFEIVNPEILEKIALKFINKSRNYFLTYKQKLNLSKQSIINVAEGYALSLQEQGKCTLSPHIFKEIFVQIKKYRNEALSEVLERMFFLNMASSNYQRMVGFYIATEKGKGESISLYKVLPSLFFANWDAQSLKDNQQYREILSDFLGTSFIKLTLKNANKPLLQNLLLAASALEKDSSLHPSDKLKIFAGVCDIGKEKSEAAISEVTSNLRNLRFLSTLKLGSSLNIPFKQKASEELSALFKEVAIKGSLISSHLEKIKNIEEKYLNTFVTNARIPGSLATYESGFRSLSYNERQLISPDFLIDLSRFVDMCLEKMPEERYRLDINPNLQELFEKFPAVFKNWKQSLPPIELEFSQKTVEGKSNKEINTLISSIENELKVYEKTDLIKAIYTNLKSFSKDLSIKEKLEILKNIEKDLHLLDPIPMDAIKSLETTYLQLNTAGGKQKLKVKDIDDPLTLFEMPTLVSQSCQNITASPAHNRCLLSYAIEGSTRMMAVEDVKGNFLARSVLRICFDENQAPFLLLEPVYQSKNISIEEAKKYLYEGALQKAESLNIPVFTMVSDSLGEEKTILSKGGASNMYYSDLSMDNERSHRIKGKIPQKLSTKPVFEIQRGKFNGPTLWSTKSSE